MAYEEFNEENSTHYGCESCDLLVEAFREAEHECRMAEDENAGIAPAKAKDLDAALRNEEDYLKKLDRLKRHRDCALEVLLKHQRYEHG